MPDQPLSGSRSWLRIRLRTLFLLTAVVAVVLSLWVSPARRQRKAVEELKKMHAVVLYDYEFDSQGVFDPKSQPPGPDWLRELLGIDYLANVESAYFGARDQEASRILQSKLGSPKALWTWQESISSIDDEALQFLPDLPHLKRLDLSGTQVSDRGLDLVSRLTGLEEIKLPSSNVTVAGLAKLKNLHSLRVLKWVPYGRGMTTITDREVAVFAVLPLLESVEGFEFHVSDDSMVHLCQLQRVKSLNFQSHPRLTDRGCRELAKMQQLEQLGLVGSGISDEALKTIGQLHNLKRLYLGYTKITDAGLSELTQLKSLEILTLTSSHVTDNGLVHLEKLPKLAWVDLSYTPVTDEGARQLLKILSLRKAILAGTQVNEELQTELRSPVRRSARLR